MNKLAFIVWAFVAALFASCSDDELQNDLPKESKEPYTITFNLSIESGDGLSVSTRSGEDGVERIDLTKYLVYVYWFHGDAEDNDMGNMTLMDKQPELIGETKYFYSKTFEGEEVGKRHAYLFLAVPKDKGLDKVIQMSNMKDFGPVYSNGYGHGYFTTSSQAMSESSLLKNCYILFFEDDISEATNDTEFSANRKLEIFGEGCTLLPDYHSFTEDVVLKRQFGIVRIKANSRDFTGKAVTCKINSDYYRLYLTQMIKVANGTQPETFSKEYVSTNEAESQDGADMGYTGDYFSNTYMYSDENSNYVTASLIWKKDNVTAEDLGEEGNIDIYLPYTTATSVGTTPSSEEQTNYSYYQIGALSTPSLTLEIEGEKYEYTNQFPIYRNGITPFYIKGTQMVIDWGDSDSGINLDNDDWDGITPNETN